MIRKVLLLIGLMLIPFWTAAQTPCTPGVNISCTPNLSLWVPGLNYPNWNTPLNNNWLLLDNFATNTPKLNAANTFSANITAPAFIGNLTGNASGTAGGLSGAPNIVVTNLTASGTITFAGIASISGSDCVQVNATGVFSNTGSPCASSFSQVYPGAGIAVSTGSAWTTSLTAPSSTIVGISDSQTISNKSFGSGMTWPTFNQNTTGYAAGIAGGALGSVPYQSALNTTTFLASPTTNGHTFVLAWQPTGSAIAPVALDLASPPAIGGGTPAAGTFTTLTFTLDASATNCASAASPAVCAAAPAGAFVVAASTTSVVVDTTAVTANSEVIVQEDSSLGTRLSVTCNVTPATAPPTISARTAGTSFTVTTTSPTTNPRCFTYRIVN